jgi:hypothetical protein
MNTMPLAGIYAPSGIRIDEFERPVSGPRWNTAIAQIHTFFIAAPNPERHRNV